MGVAQSVKLSERHETGFIPIGAIDLSGLPFLNGTITAVTGAVGMAIRSITLWR
jgi:hypothetical protein